MLSLVLVWKVNSVSQFLDKLEVIFYFKNCVKCLSAPTVQHHVFKASGNAKLEQRNHYTYTFGVSCI